MDTTPDYAMFLKLLNLTTSSFDHEALSAIRMANAVLARQNHTWEDLLAGKVVMIAAPDSKIVGEKSATGTRHYNGAVINAYFNSLSRRDLGTFQDWVNSVREWWDTKGFLTEAQFTTLKRAAMRH